jgi:hypothetical protein
MTTKLKWMTESGENGKEKTTDEGLLVFQFCVNGIFCPT